MEAYELYFNPKIKKDLAFETFCFEPENAKEKNLGNLYLAGAISGEDKAGLSLISEIAALIKAQYYNTESKDPESALKEVLAQANKLLSGIDSASRPISFFALSALDKKINFSGFGSGIKIIFNQKGKITQADQTKKNEKHHFKNIMSGNLSLDGSVIILSSGLLDFFSRKNILEKIVFEKEFKKISNILDKFKKETKDLSGFCLFLHPKQKILPEKIIPDKKIKKTALRALSFAKAWDFKKIIPSFAFGFYNFKKYRPQKNSLKIFDFLKNAVIRLKKYSKKIPAKIRNRKKDFLCFILLILIFLAGFLMSQENKKKELDSALKEIRQAETLVSEADLLIRQKKDKEANLILQKAFDQISLEIKRSRAAMKEAEDLKNKIQDKLYSLNKLRQNTPFETVLELSKAKTALVPNNIISHEEKFYLFNSMSDKLLVYDFKDKSGETFSFGSNLKFGKILNNGRIIFIDSKNQAHLFSNKGIQSLQSLVLPYSGTELQSFEIFKNNFYFLSYDDEDKNFLKKIIKYEYSGDLKWDAPEIWLEKTEKNSISISADGLLWVLSSDGTIRSYYGGKFQDEIKLKIFPYLKNISKISTQSSLSHLYLLEPVEKRIIILDKSGNVLKQIQNNEWNGLRDFSISPDGKNIYMLNENKILKISL